MIRVIVVNAVICALAACGSKDDGAAPTKSKPGVDAGVAKAAKTKAKTLQQPPSSPLPEVGPHPDYPTPVAAGTDKIFLLEEPDRGPAAPLDFAIPKLTKAWSDTASCMTFPADVVCRGTRAGRVAAARVRREADAIVVEDITGPETETHVYVIANGAVAKRIAYDTHGRVASALMFATPHRYAKRMRNGGNGLAGCGFMEFTADKAGHITDERCLQWSGDPMRDTRGVYKTTFELDKAGSRTQLAYFGIDGAPVVATSGVHAIKYELDGDGREIAQHYLGLDGKPATDTDRCHGRATEYDARGLVVRSTCIGADTKPSNDATGVATREYAYDAHGCKIRMRELAAPGAKSAGNGEDYVVDDACEVTSHTCVQADGNRRTCGVGEPARYDYKRDAAGRITSQQSYGVDGSPTKDATWSAFELRYQYDDLDNRTAIACFDATATAIECGHFGFHEQRSQWDDAGHEVTRTYADAKGAVTTNIGATTRKFTYDNYDHLFEAKGLDANGTLIDTLGMAVQRDLWDPSHRWFAVVLLDKAGKPAHYSGCFGGQTCAKDWHAVRLVRGPDGRVTKNQFFDAAGQLVQTTTCTKVRCFK